MVVQEAESAEIIFQSAMAKIYSQTDRLFEKLLVFEFLAAIAFCLAFPNSDVSNGQTKPWATLLISGTIVIIPLLFIRYLPGALITRHFSSVVQILVAALWIHLLGGKEESHFSIFFSLALIAFYRDWRVLASATLTILSWYYFKRVSSGSSFGIGLLEPQNFIEHIGWIFFVNTILVLANRQIVEEVRRGAERESRLQQSEQTYRTLFQLNGGGNWEIDTNTARIKKVNNKMCDLFGYSEDEFKELTLADVVPDDERKDRMLAFKNVVSTTKEWTAERRYKRKDGSIFWGLIAAAFVRDVSGLGQNALATVQDITKLKNIEKQLELARDRAEEANQAKTEFLANVSHEIRTPLGAILGFSQIMMENRDLSLENRSNLAIILRNGQQLYSIIEDILDISKVESNNFEIKKMNFKLADSLDDIMSILTVKGKAKGLTISTYNSNPLPEYIFTDPLRFRQLLLNIIGNSIKFTEKGQIDISLRYQCAEKSNSILEICVSDTGPGIPDEKRAKLFQPFTQTDSAASRRHGGTGLGLYLGKRIANALGGDVTLNDYVQGSGCTFKITVDIGQTISSNLIDLNVWKKSSGAMPEMSDSRCDGIRVLVVDDSPDNLLLTSKFLTAQGASVELAAGAEKAIKKLESQSFDIVIMDIQMPGMDGYQAVGLLRLKGYKKPILALTAHAMPGERERCLKAGFDNYLVKPINKKSLIYAVRKHYLEAHLPKASEISM